MDDDVGGSRVFEPQVALQLAGKRMGGGEPRPGVGGDRQQRGWPDLGLANLQANRRPAEDPLDAVGEAALYGRVLQRDGRLERFEVRVDGDDLRVQARDGGLDALGDLVRVLQADLRVELDVQGDDRGAVGLGVDPDVVDVADRSVGEGG